MILQRYSFIFRIFIIVLIAGAYQIPCIAQDENAVNEEILQSEIVDSLNVSEPALVEGEIKIADTIPPKKFISGFELAIDYGKLLTLWTEFENKYEGGINIRFFERIVLAGEFGYAELNPLKAYDNALYYTVKGSFARLGLDYYTSYDPKSFYYAGLRYGISRFEDDGKFLIDSEYWEDYEEGFGSENVEASWVEIVLGTETYLKLGKKNATNPKSKLLLGWKFRLRILTDFENREDPGIYSIPGYGRTFDKTIPALNFYIKYRIGN